MNRNPESEHFKKQLDDYISPNSLFTQIDRQRILERIEGAKRRKKWWGKPRLVLSFLLLLIFSGAVYGFLKPAEQEIASHPSAKEMIDSLYVGMSEEEVWTRLGTDYSEVEGAMDSEPIYDIHRYDYPLEEGYQFITDMDGFDVEGFKSEKMGMQVFVDYDDNHLVAGYAVVYKKENGETVIYDVFGDKVQEIVAIPVD